MKLFRKYLAVLLLIAVVSDTCGIYLIFLIQRQIARDEIERSIKNKYSHLITEKLVFEKGSREYKLLASGTVREFGYRGNMYDVVRLKKRGSHLVIHAINDTREKRLVNNFIRNQKSNSAGALKLIKILRLNALYSDYDLITIKSPESIGPGFNNTGDYTLIFNPVLVADPPPRA